MKKLKIAAIVMVVFFVITMVFKIAIQYVDSEYSYNLYKIAEVIHSISSVLLVIIVILILILKEKNKANININKIKALEKRINEKIVIKVIYDILSKNNLKIKRLLDKYNVIQKITIDDDIIQLQLSYFIKENKKSIIVGFDTSSYLIKPCGQKLILDDYSYDNIISLIEEEINDKCIEEINDKCIEEINDKCIEGINTPIAIKKNLKKIVPFNEMKNIKLPISFWILLFTIAVVVIYIYIVFMIKIYPLLDVSDFVSYSIISNELYIPTIISISLASLSLIIAIIEFIKNKDNSIFKGLCVVAIIISLAVILLFIYILIMIMGVRL